MTGQFIVHGRSNDGLDESSTELMLFAIYPCRNLLRLSLKTPPPDSSKEEYREAHEDGCRHERDRDVDIAIACDLRKNPCPCRGKYEEHQRLK
jgi:hypothetical protein